MYAEGEDCPPGQYRTEGVSVSCEACPAGTFRSVKGGVGLDSCSPCKPGYFGAGTGATEDTCSGQCDKGHYCLAGSVNRKQNKCPPGTYGDATGLNTAECSGECPAGYYCEEGTVDYTLTVCSDGFWGGPGQEVATCAGSCEPGYICQNGATSPQNEECGVGFYCTFEAKERKAIPSGYFGIGGSGDTTRSAVLLCERGSFCTGGAMFPCAAGRYGTKVGETNPECTGECQAGFFCPPGSTTATQAPCEVADDDRRGTYCPKGTPDVLLVDLGHYSTPEDKPWLERSAQEPCTADYRCSNGTRTKYVDWKPETGCVGDVPATERAVPENTPNAAVGAFGAVADYEDSPPVTYSIVSQTVPVGCSLVDPFVYDDNDLAPLLHLGADALDYEDCGTVDLVLRATAGAATVDCAVTIVTGDANEAPVLEATYARSVPEASEPGTLVDGGPIMAVENDVGQEVSYVIVPGLGDEGLDMFRVGSCSGQLSVAKAGLDHESKASYDLHIRATDNGLPAALSVTTVVTISVLNVNDAPTFTDDKWTLQVIENAGTGTHVGTIGATDGDGDAIAFSLTKNHDGAFTINANTGEIQVQLTGGAKLNFESKNVYQIEVTVKEC